MIPKIIMHLFCNFDLDQSKWKQLKKKQEKFEREYWAISNADSVCWKRCGERKRWKRQNSAMYDKETTAITNVPLLLIYLSKQLLLFQNELGFLTVFHWAHALSCILYTNIIANTRRALLHEKKIIYSFVSITFIDGNLLWTCTKHIIVVK